MPSAKETSFLIDVMPETTSDSYSTRDVDALVSRIKENLRLSNNLKSRSSLHPTKMRMSPYKLPATARCPSEPPTSYSCYNRSKEQHHHHHQEDYDDSHEILQSLLRQGALIKEAVKRLRATDLDLLSLRASSGAHQHHQQRRRATNFNSDTTLDSLTDQEDDEDDDYVDSEEDEVDRQNNVAIACRLFDEQRHHMMQEQR